ncbi:beta-ketoacyl synthase [Nocardia altamirensis]|uniref:beta-ketoacyl synthase n=1 Tax=Nocardia altamirensis TaxID=472158 RepID=UPI0009FCB6E0|nr:beta-ketoacyl synthase [Nocardia altamirensis]
MTVLEFDGIPFDPTGAPAPEAVQVTGAAQGAVLVDGGGQTPAPSRQSEPAAEPSQEVPGGHAHGDQGERAPAAVDVSHRDEAGASVPAPAGTTGTVGRIAGPLSEVRAGVVGAHRAALAAQLALQRAVWERAMRSTVSGSAGTVGAVAGPAGGHTESQTDWRRAGESGNGASGVYARGTDVAAAEHAFKPLARTQRTSLDAEALRLLTEGDVVDVFGAGHYRPGVVTAARLATAGTLVLTEVTTIELYGGTGRGRVVARFDGDPGAAAVQAAEVFALFTGIPLCLSGSTFVASHSGGAGTTASPVGASVELVVTAIDLVPRPHVTATAKVAGAQGEWQVTVTAVEPAGTGVGPGQAVPSLLLNEFHMTHLSRGDQSIAMGPEFAEYTGVRATRLPTGGLLLVDRVLEFDGTRGQLDSASYRTEYDSPADSWYYGDTANESMPHFVYMETSLQAALLMGYYAGPTLTQPGVTLSLRNLGGTATVLRQIDLRGKTIEQSSRLLSTTILPGSSLQTFDYTLSVDGEPFYAGETMFGYFSDEALANQTGLDAGRAAPTWLDEHPDAPIRRIDVAARRADPRAPLCARRTLALIDGIDVVDGGGKYEAGYLHSLREIDGSDWYFDRHFHLDPVIPGSLGVESVIHALQEWLLDAGFADTLHDPVFRIPGDIAFSWRYRGQFLPTDGTVELEAHIKEVRRGPRGVTVIADGSLWKPGLRIYELIDLAVELGERKDS